MYEGPSSDRTNFTVTEEPSEWNRTKVLSEDLTIMIGLAVKRSAPPKAGEEQSAHRHAALA